MAFTADQTTDIGKVRLLLWDMDSTKPIFPDDNQISSLLVMELGDVKQAAALGYEIIAANRVLTLQVISLLDLKTDGASMSKALLATAERLRNFSNTDWAGFDFAEVTDTSLFAFREKMFKMLLAQAL